MWFKITCLRWRKIVAYTNISRLISINRRVLFIAFFYSFKTDRAPNQYFQKNSWSQGRFKPALWSKTVSTGPEPIQIVDGGLQ